MHAERGYKYLPRNRGPFLNLTQRGFAFSHGSTINGPMLLNGLSVQASVFLEIPLVKKQGTAIMKSASAICIAWLSYNIHSSG